MRATRITESDLHMSGHGIDPYAYLVDVLQRIDTHLAKDVAWLTPRLWKKRYAEAPLRWEIDRR